MHDAEEERSGSAPIDGVVDCGEQRLHHGEKERAGSAPVYSRSLLKKREVRNAEQERGSAPVSGVCYRRGRDAAKGKRAGNAHVADERGCVFIVCFERMVMFVGTRLFAWRAVLCCSHRLHAFGSIISANPKLVDCSENTASCGTVTFLNRLATG